MYQHNTTGYQWIPSVFMMQGLPFAWVTVFSAILYKNFGFTNSEIALYTSVFTLPWVLKFLFSPALENLLTKKTIALTMQFLMAVFALALALTIYHPAYLNLSGIIFLLIAFASSIHDMSVDGLYLECLDIKAQAKFIGIRTIFYQLGKLICQSGIIYLIGLFVITFGKEVSWSLACCSLAMIILVLAFYNYKAIPNIQNTNEISLNLLHSYKKVFAEVRQLPHLWAGIIFILLYNLPESQLIKIVPLFMLDKTQHGGLNLSVANVGIIYGGISVMSMLAGITLSSFLLHQFGLKKCLVPFTIFNVLGNSSYLFLQIYSSHIIWQISLCVIVAQFFFGMSNGAYLFYLLNLFGRGYYAMSLYAIGTAIMLLGMMLAGSVAGYMQSLLGYPGFFVWILLAGLCIVGLAIYNVKTNTLGDML